MFIKQDMGFGDLMENCWSGALDTLITIEEHDKEEELMEFLINEFTGIPELTEINDLLWFESDFVFETLRISESDEEESE